jgi:hypothetical protein
MGVIHGQMLKTEIHENIRNLIHNDHANDPAFSDRLARFHQEITTIQSYIPPAYLDEMRGVADGAEVSYEQIIYLNLFPEVFHCLGLTVQDSFTTDGSLYHVRALDYGIGMDLEKSNVIIVADPAKGIPFVNITYAGFIGCITGMSLAHLSIGEIGGKGYGDWHGLPMSFLLREILQHANSLEKAVAMVNESKRTCEYFYLFADGRKNMATSLYATPKKIYSISPGENYVLKFSCESKHLFECSINEFFSTGSKEKAKPYYVKKFDQVRDFLGLTGFSDPWRFSFLQQRLEKFSTPIDSKALIQLIKKPVGRKSNLHNAIFHPKTLQFWLSHKEGNTPAFDNTYQHFDVKTLFSKKRPYAMG